MKDLFEEHAQQHVLRNPVDKGSPRSYENSTSGRAILYVFFLKLGRTGREAAGKASSSQGRGKPLASAYQLPKTHIQLKSHKSCSMDYPSDRAMLSGLSSTNTEIAKSHLYQRGPIYLCLTVHHIQGILRQGCSHPTYKQ